MNSNVWMSDWFPPTFSPVISKRQESVKSWSLEISCQKMHWWRGNEEELGRCQMHFSADKSMAAYVRGLIVTLTWHWMWIRLTTQKRFLVIITGRSLKSLAQSPAAAAIVKKPPSDRILRVVWIAHPGHHEGLQQTHSLQLICRQIWSHRHAENRGKITRVYDEKYTPKAWTSNMPCFSTVRHFVKFLELEVKHHCQLCSHRELPGWSDSFFVPFTTLELWDWCGKNWLDGKCPLAVPLFPFRSRYHWEHHSYKASSFTLPLWLSTAPSFTVLSEVRDFSVHKAVTSTFGQTQARITWMNGATA